MISDTPSEQDAPSSPSNRSTKGLRNIKALRGSAQKHRFKRGTNVAEQEWEWRPKRDFPPIGIFWKPKPQRTGRVPLPVHLILAPRDPIALGWIALNLHDAGDDKGNEHREVVMDEPKRREKACRAANKDNKLYSASSPTVSTQAGGCIQLQNSRSVSVFWTGLPSGYPRLRKGGSRLHDYLGGLRRSRYPQWISNPGEHIGGTLYAKQPKTVIMTDYRIQHHRKQTKIDVEARRRVLSGTLKPSRTKELTKDLISISTDQSDFAREWRAYDISPLPEINAAAFARQPTAENTGEIKDGGAIPKPISNSVPPNTNAAGWRPGAVTQTQAERRLKRKRGSMNYESTPDDSDEAEANNGQVAGPERIPVANEQPWATEMAASPSVKIAGLAQRDRISKIDLNLPGCPGIVDKERRALQLAFMRTLVLDVFAGASRSSDAI
ncbi:hypothetical protein HOY80DRAFT_1115665 [Tuber brumale]|nr:hypothetical protein HOY80DRAFT_1115665 [Tuber brumale]